MFLFVMILLLLATAFGVLGAVLKAVAFLVVTVVLTVTRARRDRLVGVDTEGP